MNEFCGTPSKTLQFRHSSYIWDLEASLSANQDWSLRLNASFSTGSSSSSWTLLSCVEACWSRLFAIQLNCKSSLQRQDPDFFSCQANSSLFLPFPSSLRIFRRSNFKCKSWSPSLVWESWSSFETSSSEGLLGSSSFGSWPHVGLRLQECWKLLAILHSQFLNWASRSFAEIDGIRSRTYLGSSPE